jgi:hypothetical protein
MTETETRSAKDNYKICCAEFETVTVRGTRAAHRENIIQGYK